MSRVRTRRLANDSKSDDGSEKNDWASIKVAMIHEHHAIDRNPNRNEQRFLTNIALNVPVIRQLIGATTYEEENQRTVASIHLTGHLLVIEYTPFVSVRVDSSVPLFCRTMLDLVDQTRRCLDADADAKKFEYISTAEKGV